MLVVFDASVFAISVTITIIQGASQMIEETRIDKTLDVKGEVCPFPWVKAKKTLRKLEVGQVLCIIGDHGPALKNIPRNFTDEGQAVLKADSTGEVDWEIVVRREK